MLIEVIPQSHSISTRPLTYFVGDVLRSDISVGVWVCIPLWKNDIFWIVARTDGVPVPWIEIREVLSVVHPQPLLAPYQIELIEQISQKYMLPIHRVLQWFFPRPIELRLQKKWFDILLPFNQNHIPVQDSGRLLLSQNEILHANILRLFLTHSQVIVVPDDFTLLQYERDFSQDTTLFVFQEMTDTKKAQAWIDITNGKYTRIFWTRRILYYNLQAYSNILYLEDAFQGEYFHFPTRIQYIHILSFLEKTKKFHIDILTSSPLLKTLHTFRHFPLEHIPSSE